MRIIFDHEIEELDELYKNAKIEDKGDVDLADEEIMKIVDDFGRNIQYFDISILVVYLGIKKAEPIAKLSILIETIITDLGWEKFLQFSDELKASIAHRLAQEEAKSVAQETESSGTEEAVEHGEVN